MAATCAAIADVSASIAWLNARRSRRSSAASPCSWALENCWRLRLCSSSACLTAWCRSIRSPSGEDMALDGSIDLLCLGDDRLRRGHAGGNHHFANCGFRIRRRFEVAELIADRNSERSPPEFVVLVPDVDFGAMGGEKFHDQGQVLIGGGVHRGLAIVVDGIDVGTKVEQDLDR